VSCSSRWLVTIKPLLLPSERLFSLCSLLPVAILDELAILTDQQLTQLHMAEYEVDPLLFDHFEAQRTWLQQIRGAVGTKGETRFRLFLLSAFL
jgi:hypothetical protein